MAESAFKKLEGKLQKKGAANPGGLAAWIGKRKLGAAKFNARARRGRSRG